MDTLIERESDRLVGRTTDIMCRLNLKYRRATGDGVLDTESDSPGLRSTLCQAG